MELKFMFNNCGINCNNSSNCTFMELKYSLNIRLTTIKKMF